MRTIIAGSRDITDPWELEKALRKIDWQITEVVCGGARGPDKLGELWAKYHGIPVRYFIPQWQRADGSTDRGAGFRRNIEMALYGEALVAIWDARSRGTAHMICTAEGYKRRTLIHIPNYESEQRYGTP